MARYIDADDFYKRQAKRCNYNSPIIGTCTMDNITLREALKKQPTADVVEVADVSGQIIRKKAEIIDYWKNNVKQYRAMQGYCDIEHDTDNFLRGYNEAVEDMLAILDGARMDGDEDGV